MGQWIEGFSLLQGPEWKATEVAFCKGPALGPVCAIYSGRVPDCGSPRVIRCRYPMGKMMRRACSIRLEIILD